MLMQSCSKYGVIFIITKFGFVYLYEISTASVLGRQKLTDQICVVSAKNPNTDGMVVINKAGQIFSINVNEANLISFINSAAHIPDRQTLAFNLAQRFRLPGANDQFVALFNQKLQMQDYVGAANVAKNSPGELLRNPETINRIKSLPQTGQAPPILLYFNTLLKSTKLNAFESVELAKPVIQQNKLNLIEAWIKESKLTMSDELGDLIRQANPQMALSIYQQSGSPDKVIQGLIETNQLEQIMPYCQKTGHSPDFIKILRQIMPHNSLACVNLARMITNREPGPPRADITQVMNVFLEFSKIQDCTAFLVQALEHNRMDESHLQTKLFEMNLMSAPNVAEGIFKLNKFSQYDKEKIAKLCEQCGLYGRALQNYQNILDIKRVIVNVHAISEDIVFDVFGRMGEDDCLQCLVEMLKINRQNEQMVAKIAVKFAAQLDNKKCLEIFDSFGSNQGQLFFLTHILPHTQDQDIYFKYIEACSRIGNFREVERVIKETENYDPVRVKDFLKEARLQDPRPLIYVCDQHNFIDELTRYLFNQKQNKFIEVYLFRVNPNATPKVLGTLLELDCDEVYIQQLLNTVRNCPVDELIEEFESRGKLKMLQSWLEARNEERNQDPALHNALAMIYIDTNQNPEKFLVENKFYDSKAIGKFSEERNPDYAVIAYQRDWGNCDDELIAITNKSYQYRIQAKYLVERHDEELWAKVLDEANPCREQIIDQVIINALNESKDSDEVSIAVKAFMAANIQDKLVELLERIVLHNSQFQNEKNLQNLLILTAIKEKLPKLKDYIGQLNNYDGVGLAQVAQSDEHQLYEEALCIYKKFGENVEAVKVLLYKMDDKMREAHEFAEKSNLAEVWTELGKAYLDQFMPKEAIESFIKANNPHMYMMVINVSQQKETYESLVQFLLMARKQLKEQVIDSELIFSFAKCGEKYVADLENFISEPNQADIMQVGDKCMEHSLYYAAKVLYQKYGNNQKLARAYVMLREFNSAYEAAKKADIPKVWKQVCYSCIRSKEFRFAQLCGLNIVIKPDHLEELIQFYEAFGYSEDLMKLLEQGINHERSHNGIFTELAIMYCKYRPQKLRDFIQAQVKKLQIPRLIKVCENYKMWNEAVQLHIAYEQRDQAIRTMMEHSGVAFNFDLFAENIVKVSNENLLYDSIIFFIEEEPSLLENLLTRVQNKLDLSRCVKTVRQTGYIGLIEEFLKSQQGMNVPAVNETLNQLFLEKADFKSLEQSIKSYDSFEAGELAHQLEKNELLDCRRISALLYRKNQKYSKSIEISIKDDMFKDAMETVSESKDTQLCEDLMRAINEKNDRELFAAMLYTCYELIKPDVAMEMAWRNNMMEFVMPFMIQMMRDTTNRVDTVQKVNETIKKKEEKKEQENRDRPLDQFPIADMMFTPQMPTQLAITGGSMGGMPQMNMPNMGGFGAPGMGAPGMGAPGMGAPGMGAPGMGAPGMGAPGMGAPGMGAPGMGAPGMGMDMGGFGQPQNPGQGMGGFPGGSTF